MSRNNSLSLSAPNGSVCQLDTGLGGTRARGLPRSSFSKPARKRKGVLSTSRDSALKRVPTGLLPVWRHDNK
jgi:hypothetical protein